MHEIPGGRDFGTLGDESKASTLADMGSDDASTCARAVPTLRVAVVLMLVLGCVACGRIGTTGLIVVVVAPLSATVDAAAAVVASLDAASSCVTLSSSAEL